MVEYSKLKIGDKLLFQKTKTIYTVLEKLGNNGLKISWKGSDGKQETDNYYPSEYCFRDDWEYVEIKDWKKRVMR